MSGGKGGSKTQETQIPKWAEDFARYNIDKGKTASEIGYLPWTGPDVAALSPMQEQAMRNTGSAAQSFGLADEGFDPLGGLPQAEEFAGGVRGYSSFPMFQEGVNDLYEIAPGSMQKYDSLFAQNVSPEFQGKAAYYDPNNPEMAEAREAEIENGGANQYPPGYEWLAMLQNGGGSGFRNYSGQNSGRGFHQRFVPAQQSYQGGGGLPPWLYGQQ